MPKPFARLALVTAVWITSAPLAVLAQFGAQPASPATAQPSAAPPQYAAPQSPAQQPAAPPQYSQQPAAMQPAPAQASPQYAPPQQQPYPATAGAPQQPYAPANQQPQYRVAATPTPPNPAEINSAAPTAAEHPLMPALRWAQEGLPHIRAIQDYTCMLYKRERVDGVLGEYQTMSIKVRHQPFSVYMYFMGPPNMRGQEVLYVEGQNNNELQAHGVGLKNAIGTVSLSPTGRMAMKGNRYPITELGVENLVQRLLEVGERDTRYGECDVQFLKAKINGRGCTCIQVTHPVPRRNFLFHLARIYVDDELNIPIRYESFDWPSRAGGPPELIEEYTYQNLKLNNNFTDLDFDIRNPKYGFK
ncbi:MAG: DUF1571 domain-containing protein [Pirellulales bacterium]|nr:DUF1571 domain-containing protein [Pirellulales bacterium]